ncbi:ankyrin repeat-containing domain protein [Pavlovales sp. CCMP2436]|nr:ankyrin repeat-containing domain protein [Pavlovales sp. CCMP2436]|mmetsp:Transcript_12250/g.28608  ORF Transcript_12250/g.28608 Transcript_12250/m.28608 type:complete len:328 (+) Transcript_12250:1-984(+)
MGALFSSSSSAANPRGADELVAAGLAGDLTILVRLLNDGCSVAAQDASGNHALGAACCGGHAEVVAEILSRAEVDGGLAALLELRNDIGTTPCWLAAGYGHTGLVEALLARGARGDAPNKAGDTPLLAATSKGQIQVVEALLRANVSPATPSATGDTPLLLACSRANVEIVKLLLASVSADAASAAKLLQAANGKKVTPLSAAASAANAELVALLCAASDARTLRAMKTATDANHATPLSVAAFCKAEDVVSILLAPDDGGALDLRDAAGNVALWIAAAAGSAAIVRQLLDAGAVRHANSAGLTPLEAARQNGHSGCVELLETAPSS